MKYMIMTVFVVFCVMAAIISGPSWTAEAGEEAGYGYSYPQQVGGDYVYRTGRIFYPDKKNKWLSALTAIFNRGSGNDTLEAVPVEQATELKLQVRELSRQLLAHSKEPVDEESRIVVSTFVNLNQLYKTSGLGRAISELMISELQRLGFDVVEVRMTPALQISEGYGEYSLSRNMSQLSYVQDAQAVVVGTYTVSDGQVVVSSRLLQQHDGLVLSSGTMAFPVNNFVGGLLADEAIPPKRGTFVELHGFSEIAPE
ncbi:MAG: hypothetical protein KQH63_12485 [Desulfobulbaceae bacterium]|nr:hypothetical protein [Desulfobulbaceae bacterium]